MRLLVATKQLLESLTRWARGASTERDVSDIYVNLGNEFNVVCRAFLTVGIDVADLGDVPQALRVILEKALSENASQETLDQYLPSIQEIIVNMLRRLKQKQAIMRSGIQRPQPQPQPQLPSQQSQYPPTVPTHMPQSSMSSSGSSSQSYDQKILSNTTSSGSYHGTPRKFPTRSESLSSMSSRQNSQTSQTTDANSYGHQHQLSQSHPLPQHQQSQSRQQQQAAKDTLAASFSGSTPISRKEFLRAQASRNNAHTPAGGANSTESNALAALQRSEALERRASRRFSAFQFAKLANGVSTTDLPPLPSSSDLQGSSPYLPTTGTHSSTLPDYTTSTSMVGYGGTAEPESLETSRDNISLPATPGDRSEGSAKEITLFLQLGPRTKKITTNPYDLTISSLRFKFIEIFGHSMASDVIPELSLTDPKTNIKYELDELSMEDVRAGNILVTMNADPMTPDDNPDIKKLETLLVSRMDSIDKILARFDPQQAQVITTSIEERPDSRNSETSTSAGKDRSVSTSSASAEPGSAKPDMAVVNKAIKRLQSLQKDVAVVRQLGTQSLGSIKDQMLELREKVGALKNAAIIQNASTSRGYMEACHKKLSDDSDNLLTSVDELQDVVEALRKDVAIRRVRQSPRQLEAVTKDLKSAETKLKEMDEYIQSEKAGWQKIWERELESICEEQQFVKLQQELVQDLHDDLQKTRETLDLVEACSAEQSKSVGSRQMFAAAINPAPADGITHVKDMVMSEVSALQPNHEQRVEAIERAEKMRKRELELRLGGEFAEELGEFVSENKLKKSGGIEEAERQRRIREQKVLEEQAKTDQVVREQRAEERKKKKEKEGTKKDEKDKDKKEKKKKKKDRTKDAVLDSGKTNNKDEDYSAAGVNSTDSLLGRPSTPGKAEEFDTAEEGSEPEDKSAKDELI